MNELELVHGNFVVPEIFFSNRALFFHGKVSVGLRVTIKSGDLPQLLTRVSALEFSLSFHAKDSKCFAMVSLKAASFAKVKCLLNKNTFA